MPAVSRRSFLGQLAGGAIIATGTPNKSVKQLIPYVVPDEQITPGTWNFIATTCRECPAGCGMHLWHRDGRVTKAEGNPEHPVNRGGLCPRGQSAVQGLYDPDRIKEIAYRGTADVPEQPMWAMAIEEIGNRIKGTSGKVALLSNLQTGSLADLMRSFVKAFGSERLVFYEPFNYEPLRDAHEAVFGLDAIPDYRLDGCDFIISFVADFLESWISPVQFASHFAAMHAFKDGRMGRMAYVGPRLSLTAANADDFVHVPPGAEYWIAMAMLATIVRKGWARVDVGTIQPVVEAFDSSVPEALTALISSAQIEGLAGEFVNASASVALPGPVGAKGGMAYQTAVAVALLNWAAGRVGQTVDFSRPHALGTTAREAQIKAFLESIAPDDVLLIHEANPVYSIRGAATDIRRAGLSVYMGSMPDETSELATWVLPTHTSLETWGDYSPHGSIHGFLQPTMAPLYDTSSAGDVLIGLTQVAEAPLLQSGFEKPAADYVEWVEQSWQTLAARLDPGRSYTAFRHDALKAGVVSETATPATTQIRPEVASMTLAPATFAAGEASSAKVWPWASIMVFDGRVANRAWLQENPEPTSYIAWGNYVDMHPAKAQALGLAADDLLELKTSDGAMIQAPVRVTEDVVENVVALAFGHGHTALGRNAAGRGANAFMLLGEPVDDVMFATVSLRKAVGTQRPVYSTQTQEQHERRVIQTVELSELRTMKPGEGEALIMPLPEGYRADRDVYSPHEYKEHRWAMVIDLARCIGCGACAVACYAENNNALVGGYRMAEGRELSWLRVIPYRDQDNARRLDFIPMLCQHCDAAPCEPVCPVFASVHTDEGLNAQVYNRCIGTRYCSNNCPYKVRRFNWLNVEWPEPLPLQLNPEVTVRPRGVMEKCTFCIQRIRQVEHRAKWENRPVRDGEIKPACAQSCPTRAIVFGDLMNPEAEVTKLTRTDPRRYHLLEELNTKPGVTYLKGVRS